MTADNSDPEFVALYVRPVSSSTMELMLDEPQTPRETQAENTNLGSSIFTNLRTILDGAQNPNQTPVNKKAGQEAKDTLAGLEPFFWMLRCIGLCPILDIFSKEKSISLSYRSLSFLLKTLTIAVGLFLFLGFIATFGFSLVWPVAFCSGFHSIMDANVTYCNTDIMQRFLSPEGMNTLIQSAFLFIGTINTIVSTRACMKLRPMIKILREYLAISPAHQTQSHSKMAYFHITLTLVITSAIGIPFIAIYENMLDSLKTGTPEGYPFANIDAPLVKIEHWISYTKNNATISEVDNFILSSVKWAFRAENIMAFASCFAVPSFFSLMCDVLAKAWSSFTDCLKAEGRKESMDKNRLRTLRKSHWLLCRLTSCLDDRFSLMLLVIFIVFVLMNSCIIYVVMKYGKKSTGEDKYAFYQAILMFIAMEIVFFLAVRKAMAIHRMIMDAGEVVRNWQPVMDGVIDGEYLLFLNQVSTSDTAFTAWKCFRIDQAAYLNAAALIFSYVLLLLTYEPPGPPRLN